MKHYNQDIVLAQDENYEYNSNSRTWLLFIDCTHRSENRQKITVRHVSDTNVRTYENLKRQDEEIEGRYLFELTDAELAERLKSGELEMR